MARNDNSKIDKKIYKSYTLHNFRDIPQMQYLSEEDLFDIEVVGHVLPFKTNNYVIDELINWDDPLDDPMFTLTFPRRGMLKDEHYQEMAKLIKSNASKKDIKDAADKIREQLNPNPGGQSDLNVPTINGRKLKGMQHKYGETALFFPSQGQTCHAYCTFCFRWSQFVGLKDKKFAMKEADNLVAYIKEHREVTDILITGGDPMVMKTSALSVYINALLEADIPHLSTIRIGTKALSFWPYRFITDDDAEDLISLFHKIRKAGKHVGVMAHFSHPAELETPAVKAAIKEIRKTGAQIRTQSPIFRHINDHPNIWAKMWKKQVKLGCVPYYMFVARDTGAQHYFALPLVEAWSIFRKAYRKVSGVARTVRGPSMSCTPGKVLVVGVAETSNEKVLILKFLQGRNRSWVGKPFFAEYNDKAVWIDDLKPAFGDNKFFFEEDTEEQNVTSMNEFRFSES